MEIYKTVVLALSFVNFHEVKSIVFVFYSVQGSVNPKPFNSHSELWYKYLEAGFSKNSSMSFAENIVF